MPRLAFSSACIHEDASCDLRQPNDDDQKTGSLDSSTSTMVAADLSSHSTTCSSDDEESRTLVGSLRRLQRSSKERLQRASKEAFDTVQSLLQPRSGDINQKLVDIFDSIVQEHTQRTRTVSESGIDNAHTTLQDRRRGVETPNSWTGLQAADAPRLMVVKRASSSYCCIS